MEDVDALLREIDAYTSSRHMTDPEGTPQERQTSTVEHQNFPAYHTLEPISGQAGAYRRPMKDNSGAFHLADVPSSSWQDPPFAAYGTLTISYLVFHTLISYRSSPAGWPI